MTTKPRDCWQSERIQEDFWSWMGLGKASVCLFLSYSFFVTVILDPLTIFDWMREQLRIIVVGGHVSDRFWRHTECQVSKQQWQSQRKSCIIPGEIISLSNPVIFTWYTGFFHPNPGFRSTEREIPFITVWKRVIVEVAIVPIARMRQTMVTVTNTVLQW